MLPGSEQLQAELTERFLRYTAISSQSDASQTTVPTSPGQWDMVRLLADELRELGCVDVEISEHACLTARLPGDPRKPAIGFCAHVDTVDVNLDPRIRAQVVNAYAGGPIPLSPTVTLDPAEHPEIERYIGQDILCTDGTSVLGADNKAAIASIMTALHVIAAHDAGGQAPEPANVAGANAVEHGDVYVAFVPDEEIGLRGAKKLDLSRFPVAYAYTLDCCEIGEVCWETFNAGQARVTIEGVSAHPMSAKGVLVNPILVATDFVAMFDRLQTPENTEGTEGYIWVHGIDGNQSTARVDLNIRDHSRERYEERKAYIEQAVDLLRKRHPKARIELEMEDVYANIADSVTADNREAIDALLGALASLGIEPRRIAMRGGTDGSYLSTQGLLAPNIFTGAHNFHSRFEFLPLGSFEASCRVILQLITHAGPAAEQ